MPVPEKRKVGGSTPPLTTHSLTCINARLMIVLRNAWSHSQSQSARPNHVLSRAYPQVGGLLGPAKLRIVRSEGGRLNVHRRTSASMRFTDHGGLRCPGGGR